MPVEEVYTKFVVGVIKATGELDIILQRSAERSPDTLLPSWVPDWSALSIKEESESLATTSEVAQASGNYQHVFKDSVAKDQLCCMGFQIDAIQQLACSVFALSGEKENKHKNHNVVLSSEGPCRVYPDSAAVREAVWNAVSLNRYFSRGQRLREDTVWAFLLDLPFFDGRGSSSAFFRTIDCFQRCNRDLLIAGGPLSSHFPAWSERFEDLPEDLEIMNTLILLMVTMISRRFVITKNGYTGMVPRRAQQGDGIFILKGCSVPLVLRPNGDGTYHLVGECYRDKAMDGEAMDGEAMDGEAMDGEAMDGEAMDGEAMDGEAMDGEAMDGEAMDGEAMDGEAMDGEAMEELMKGKYQESEIVLR